MKSIFYGLLSSKSSSVLGVDIGTTSIKIVELSKGSVNPRLTNYGMLESYGHFDRPNNVIQANALKISEKDATLMLGLLLKQMKTSARVAFASIPSFAAFFNLIEMPTMSEEETSRAMAFEIKQSVPLPLSEIVVDWIRVGERTDENGFAKQQVAVIAIPNDIIERYRKIFKNVGLALKVLEVENLAYVRSVIGGDQTPTLILDIGARSTNISVVDQGFLKHNTQIDYAGDTLTQAIAKGLGISYRRAEGLKKQRGIIGSGIGEYELSTLEEPFLDVIIKEAKRVQDNFQSSFNIKVQRVLLVGGGAGLLGLEKYVREQLNLPAALGNGLIYVDVPPSLGVAMKELQTRWATAVGLGIKNFL